MAVATRPYHHGNLRQELIEAGLALTRNGGTSGLSLREATRRAGVSPNAAYRHFADRQALIDAVAVEIQDRMARRMIALAPADTAPDAALERLRAVGLGYIDFAVSEPGWFDVAFFEARTDHHRAPDPDAPVPAPYVLLVDSLDAITEAGLLSAEARAEAEWPCWSAVHGFAHLATHGPLRNRPDDELRALATRTVDAAIDGILATSR